MYTIAMFRIIVNENVTKTLHLQFNTKNNNFLSQQ